MEKVGIICEYNPFHNGHIYHIKKTKELYPDAMIILVMSGYFTERGEISLLSKWDKASIALDYGVDLVIELPFPFATESADIFAYGAISILKELKTDYLVFGSECNDIDIFEQLVNIQLYNKEYDDLVKKFLDEGHNYPTSMSEALYHLTNYRITTPNDLLGLSYIKQIKQLDANIIPTPIKRTNDYHNETLEGTITSATSIRKALLDKQSINNYVPYEVIRLLPKDSSYIDHFYDLLKYKIVSDIDELDKYLDVSEGLDKRIKKYIMDSLSYEELVAKVKTKRYTYNRINRMFLHILTGYTKEKSQQFKEISYIRILGFNRIGREYIKYLKNNTSIPLITNYSDLSNDMLSYELRISYIYSLIMKNNELKTIELKSIPIKK